MRMVAGKYITIGILALLGTGAFAQCKVFTKKRCLTEIPPFVHNGQYHGAVLFEGEEATMVQTFYSSQDYRLMICTQSILGDSVYFEVLDFEDYLLYSSKGTGKNYWDFNVESTQQLKIRMVVPEQKTGSELKQSGCTSILVGFRNEETGNTGYARKP